MNLAITGTSGNIGGMVARHLNTRGLPLILPLRNPAKAPDLPNCEARRFAYGDLDLAKQALNGVDVLFMESAAESPTREQEHLTLVQAASEAGVQTWSISLLLKRHWTVPSRWRAPMRLLKMQSCKRICATPFYATIFTAR